MLENGEFISTRLGFVSLGGILCFIVWMQHSLFWTIEAEARLELLGTISTLKDPLSSQENTPLNSYMVIMSMTMQWEKRLMAW